MALSVLRWTTAADSEEFAGLFRNEGAPQPNAFDMIGTVNGVHYPARGDRVVGSGSALFLLDPQGSERLQRDPRIQQYLDYLLHQLIRLNKGEMVDFLGICFSLQGLAVALNALANLIEKGFDPNEITTLESLQEKLCNFSWEEVWEKDHPMAMADRPEFGVLPNHIEDTTDPMLARFSQASTIPLIHVNKQVIRRAAFESAATRLQTWLKIQCLLTREIPLKGQTSTTPIVTGFRVEPANGRERTSGSESSMVGVQGHPEWPGPRLADILRRVMLDENGAHQGYLGLDKIEIAEGIAEIANATDEGHRLLENWLQRTSLSSTSLAA